MESIVENANITSLIVEIIGIIIIVISVLYLAKQTKQANIIAQGDSEREMFDSFNEILYQYSDYESIELIQRAYQDFNSLNNKEKAKFCISYVIPHFNNLDQLMGLYERGLINEERLNSAKNIVISMLKTNGVTQLWKELQQSYRPGFVVYLNKEFEKAKEIPPITEILTWYQLDKE